MHARGIPAGVIEVKTPKPDGRVLDSPLLAGQLYDYMMLLRSFYGLQSIFGVMTTYYEWRICWLDTSESKSLASATSLPHVRGEADTAGSSLKSLLDDEDVDTTNEEDEAEGEELVDPSPSLRRQVFATDIYSFSDEALLPMLASVLEKMAASKRVALPLKVFFIFFFAISLFLLLIPNIDRLVNAHSFE